MVERKIGDKVMRVVRGDITDIEIEAFVFDITEDCKLGSGYGGAIAQRGGKVVQEALDEIGTIKTGEAAATTAGKMKAEHIIHTNGPKFCESATEEKLRKAINAALGGRRGPVFTDRYHERIITNPTQCRHTLAYVLLNQRHHAYGEAASYAKNRVDPCSSAAHFNGWTVARPKPWANAPPTDTDDQPVVARPQTWLLRGGWKRGGRGRGLISPNVIPGLPPGAPPLPVW